MKTGFFSFSYSFLLTLVFLSPKNVLANTEISSNQSGQLSSNFSDLKNDYPTSYTSRIKRFHHNQQGLDYFDPSFTEDGNYFPKLKNESDKYNLSPYNFKNFQFWARLQNSSVIWQYANDENYRTIIDNWNNTNNPYWAYGISANLPFGTFDFTAGLGYQPSDLAALLNICQEGDNTDYRNFLYRRRSRITSPSSPLGYFTSRTITDETDTPPIAVESLPTRVPQQVIIDQQSIEKPNFTQHIPVSFEWKRGKGLTNGYKQHDSVISKWTRGKTSSKASNYDSLTANPGFGVNQNHSTSNSVEYGTLSTGNKSNVVNTNPSSNNYQSQTKTASKTSSTTSNNNN